MVTFRSNNTNNNRRPPFRSNNNRRPPFRSNNEGSKFSNNDNFQRKVPGRNNHNAVKLIEKYNDLAREALAKEDKILSENYFQHADHFTRVQNEQENQRIARANSSPVKQIETPKAAESIKISEITEPVASDEVIAINEEVDEVSEKSEAKKIVKSQEKKVAEKKSAIS